ncbi:hypothetical protein ACFYVW_06305 [Streptomyces tendae]|uniref:hypothetical protein n=1 Tax=Streptomyces tendae TaxID=1932 RepID=UPI003677E3C7
MRGVQVGGEDGQSLDAAVLVVAFQEPGRAVAVGVGIVEDADRSPARLGGDDGRLIQPGELGAGPGEVVGGGAEEGRVSDGRDVASGAGAAAIATVGLIVWFAVQARPRWQARVAPPLRVLPPALLFCAYATVVASAAAYDRIDWDYWLPPSESRRIIARDLCRRAS